MNTANAQTRRDRRFTIVELLVVIVIILILMGMLFPAIGMVRHNAKVTKAKTEMNAIIIAVKSYESTYGLLPGDSTWTNDPGSPMSSTYENNYDTLMQILTRVAISGAAGAPSDGNSRNVVFLDAPAKFATEGYLDPWGNRYVVLMDVVTDPDPYDNQVKLEQTVVTRIGSHAAGKILNGSVFVYCLGKDKVAGATNTKDDVVSWE